ncbi:MAG: hypothetical protein ACPF8V_10745 [Luteibaculum sp.]
MKKILMILTAVLFSFFGKAEENRKPYFASISIHSKLNANFEVWINGCRYDLYGRLDLYDLRPGNHHIKVIEHRINRRGYGFAEVIYNQDIFLPHGSQLFACIDRYGRFVIDEIRRPQPVQSYCAHSCNMRHNHFYAPRPGNGNRYYRGSSCRR